MAKKHSDKTVAKSQNSHRSLWQKIKGFVVRKGSSSYNPHKSFKRSYREDYVREMDVPGILSHVFQSFGMIFRNWRLFLPLLMIAVVLNVVLIGIMDQNNFAEYQEILDETSTELAGGDIGAVAKAGLILISTVSTGGLSAESDEVATVFGVMIFLIVWLVTIFLLRHLLAGHKVKLRDGLYNALTPLLSTLVVFIVAFLQCIPIFVLIIAYAAAVQTDFLATPFYALVFFIFAALMIVLSSYMLSSTLMAFVAVSAPGVYPLNALRAASELMMGRRVRFILRLVALIFAMVLMWVIVMIPLILFDMFMKQFEWTASIPFVPICFTIMMCFTEIYVSCYLYLYYRWMLKA